MAIFTVDYLRANTESSKQISIVVTIDGLPFQLSNRPVYSVVNYGDPIVYGEPGLVYGALRRNDDVKDILSLDGSSLTIAQRLEPEQGKGSISSFSLAFIDKDEIMTQICTPGFYFPEILGRNVTIELGYEQISYPTDYFVIFRGIITGINQRTGVYVLALSDPNVKRRQYVFLPSATTITSAITDTDTTIPVNNTGQFYQQILGPDATYDPAIKTYIKIDDEFIEYPSNGILDAVTFQLVTRGARGTVAAPHDSGASVAGYIQMQDHCIDMVLKIMLSGWNGPWISDQPLKSIIATLDGVLGNIQNAIIFPDGVDVQKKYGLVAGDYVTITGSAYPGNNITSTIIDFVDIGPFQPNQIILLADDLSTAEYPTAAVVAFRSQFDTYPVNAGLRLTPDEVDVQGHLDLKALFLSDASNSYRFLLSDQQQGKDFIEKEIYLPVSAYSVTRRGRLSVKITKPPLADAGLIILGQNNIIDPDNITFDRATNSRTFFNEINVQYDVDDAGTFLSVFDAFDSDSLSLIGLSSVMPITSLGTKTDLSPNIEANLTHRALFLLSRYKRGALTVGLKVNYGTGNLIEAGDVVALDGTGLELPNWVTADRDFGVQLFEVIDRTLDIKAGNVALKLVNGVGASASDRFATISPSSVLGGGNTTSTIFVTDSFSPADPKFPGAEHRKWDNYVGQPVVVHNEDYSVSGQSVIAAIDPVNTYKFTLSPPLGFTPPAGYILDIIPYPTSTSASVDSLYKSVQFFLSPQVLVVTGIDAFNFTVGGGDIGKFFVGAMVRVHDYSYAIDSPDVTVVDIVGNQITVNVSLGFTPAAGQFIDLIGFADKGGAYRWI